MSIFSRFVKNQIKIITFNYDYSLELLLRSALHSIALFDEKDIDQFIEQTIIHVYGSLEQRDVTVEWHTNYEDFRTFGVSDRIRSDSLARWSKVYDQIFIAASGIRTIDGVDKDNEVESLIEAKRQISNSQNIYILGFGFDYRNCDRIGLVNLLQNGNRSRRVLFTNYGDIGSVNKRAAQAMGVSESSFIDRKYLEVGNITFEKSVVDVYRALSQDFYVASEEAFRK